MSYRVPFNDLSVPDATRRARYLDAINKVLQHGRILLGPEVTELEEKLARFCGRKHAIGVGSGTDALIIALLAAGIGKGDEVILGAMSWIASATAIKMVGANPVFVDVNDHGNIAAAEIENAISPQTKAILAVDYSGKIAEMEALARIASGNELLLIEDAAQAFGATRKGQMAGSYGIMSCFSMNPMKVFGAFGEAGAVLTDDTGLRDRLEELRYNGMRNRTVSIQPSINARIDTIHAATMLLQLEEFPAAIARRREIASLYDRHICDMVVKPIQEEDCLDTYFCYPVRVKDRERVMEALTQSGIECKKREWDFLPAHPSMKGEKVVSSANAFTFSESMICLPIYDKLTDDNVLYVAQAVNHAVKKPGGMIIYKTQMPSEISVKDVLELKAQAAQSPRKRARIIMHDGHDSPMQQMIIALTKDSYIMPHNQTDRIKTYIIMEGSLLLVFFTESGNVQSMHELDATDGHSSIIRFDTNRWHTVVPLSDACVYMEIAQGPFEGNRWANWAPKDENSKEAADFMLRLRNMRAGKAA